MHPDARAVLAHLRMSPLPVEGGWFVQTWTSPTILAAGSVGDYRIDKPAGTAILAMFCDGSDGFSALHRLPTTEIWHFCAGDPFAMLLLGPGGMSAQPVLGSDVIGGQAVQIAVAAKTWMGGAVVAGGRFSLLGCTMAPGFTPHDFELGGRAQLCARYPAKADEIAALTRR